MGNAVTMPIPDYISFYKLDNEDFSNIIQAYNFLWNMFGDLSGLEIKGSNDELDISLQDGTVTVQSESFFKIKGVGFEAGDSGGPIDICFAPDLTIVGVEQDGEQRPVIEESHTAVSYIRVREPEDDEEGSRDKLPAEVLSAFHYDFEMEPDRHHPIFHAQYEPSSIELGELSSDYQIDNEAHVTSSCPNHPRVPTAPLDFAGVLCMLIHEHLEGHNNWPNRLLRPLELLPKLPAWCFDPNPQSGAAMLPEWWYLHADGVERVPPNVVSSRSPL